MLREVLCRVGFFLFRSVFWESGLVWFGFSPVLKGNCLYWQEITKRVVMIYESSRLLSFTCMWISLWLGCATEQLLMVGILLSLYLRAWGSYFFHKVNVLDLARISLTSTARVAGANQPLGYLMPYWCHARYIEGSASWEGGSVSNSVMAWHGVTAVSSVWYVTNLPY